LKLYGGLACPFTQRVRFLLEQAGAKYEYIEINLDENENQSEWYKAINPLGKVPALLIDEKQVLN